MWRRLVVFLVASWLVAGASLVPPVHAAEPFTTAMDVFYVVDTQGQTQVRYEIRLKNNTSTVYAKQYALQINSPDVHDVRVKTQGQVLPHNLVQSESESTISVQFPEKSQVIGRDQEQIFTIEYRSNDTAALYGRVLEVSIPQLANPAQLTQYNVRIQVPTQFGPPSLVEPTQYTRDEADGYQVLRFTNAGQTTGISVLFGQEQTYRLDLRYHITNPAQNTGVVQVALPPDTAWQKMWYDHITPAPDRVHRDADGNWIAEFRVQGEAQQVITAQAEVTVLAHPRSDMPAISAENPLKTRVGRWQIAENPYLQAQSFWPVKHPSIVKLAAEVSTPRAIFQYVVDTLDYNYQRALQPGGTQRLGVTAILQDPANAMCQEFTDLFITMARAAGIPARRVTGYAVTQNSRLRPLSLVNDILHAWPEYYDSQRQLWVPVDPTWSDTTGGLDYFSKLDLRHIAFAMQGQHDTLPMPAGLYKLENQEEKDVNVTLVTTATAAARPLQVELVPTYLPQIGLPTRATFRLTNTSGAARYNTDIALAATAPLKVWGEPIHHLPVWLPYETVELTWEVVGTDWWQASAAPIRLLIGEEEFTYDLSARRALTHPYLRVLVVVVGLAGLSAGAGSVLVFGYRWYRALRR